MSKDKLIKRFEEIIAQDAVASKAQRDNQYTQGFIDGHKQAFEAAKRLLESIQ